MSSQPPYASENFRTDGERISYWENGLLASQAGVDVSAHQEQIDWSAVAADGIDFAIIRVGYRGSTEGNIQIDDYFMSNQAGAHKAGLPIGVYFFSQATTPDEAQEEAEFTLAQLNKAGLSPADLAFPIVYDSERVYLNDNSGGKNGSGSTLGNKIMDFLGGGNSTDPDGDLANGGRTAGLSTSEMTENALAFCNTIEKAGYKAAIYGNMRDLWRYNIDQLSNYELWFAQYGVQYPSVYWQYRLWQYTSSGKVDGISSKVDLNIYMLNAPK